MAAEWKRVIQSDLVTFVVGPEKEEFKISPVLLIKLAPQFEKLINGGTAEARKRRVVWEDVEINTFLLFSKFAYTGDYFDTGLHDKGVVDLSQVDHRNGTSKPTGKTDQAAPNDNESNKARLRFESRIRFPTVEQCHRKGVSLMAEEGTVSTHKLFQKMYDEATPTEPELKHRCDFAVVSEELDILMAHTKVYVFADKNTMGTLKERSSKHLAWALFNYHIDYDGIKAISQLIRFVFKATKKGDGLREVLITWGCCVFETAAPHPDWEQVLRDVPEFSVGILLQMGLLMSQAERSKAGT
ncbi:putative BTB domain-containing protein [Seiridium cardinale]